MFRLIFECLQKKEFMNGASFLRLLKDPRAKGVFGKDSGLYTFKRRLSEENLFPIYNEPVQAEHAAKMILYSIICPCVAESYANAFIKQYEFDFAESKEGFEKTSIGYLIRLLNGSEKIPHVIRIDPQFGSISIDKNVDGRIITDAGFWPGRSERVPQSNGWPEKEVRIPGQWLEMLRDKIKAGLDV